MLVPQGGETPLFGDHPLILLERLADCASRDLGVFVVSVFCFYSEYFSMVELRHNT